MNAATFTNRSAGTAAEAVAEKIIQQANAQTPDSKERLKLIYAGFESAVAESEERKSGLEVQIHDYHGVKVDISLFHFIWYGGTLEDFAAKPEVQSAMILKEHGKAILELLRLEQVRLEELFHNWKQENSGGLSELRLNFC